MLRMPVVQRDLELGCLLYRAVQSVINSTGMEAIIMAVPGAARAGLHV